MSEDFSVLKQNKVKTLLKAKQGKQVALTQKPQIPPKYLLKLLK